MVEDIYTEIMPVKSVFQRQYDTSEINNNYYTYEMTGGYSNPIEL